MANSDVIQVRMAYVQVSELEAEFWPEAALNDGPWISAADTQPHARIARFAWDLVESVYQSRTRPALYEITITRQPR